MSVMVIDVRSQNVIDKESDKRKNADDFFARSNGSVVRLKDPSSGNPRQYFFLRDNRSNRSSEESVAELYEIQSIPKGNPRDRKRYGSYFAGSRIISNGDLYVSTRVDPLFLLLDGLTRSRSPPAAQKQTQEHKKWQPLEQIMEDVPELVRQCLKRPGDARRSADSSCPLSDQAEHFFETKILTEDMVLRRFSVEKATAWLAKKHARVARTVRDDVLESKRRVRKPRAGESSASSPSFVLPDDDDDDGGPSSVDAADSGDNGDGPRSKSSASPPPELTESEETQVKESALQLISEYVNDYWRNRLVEHLGLNPECLLSSKERKSAGQKRSVSACSRDEESEKLIQYTTGNVGVVNKDDKHEQEKTGVMDTQSPGLKRLAKANVKGMKSLSSFFGAKKQKK